MKLNNQRTFLLMFGAVAALVLTSAGYAAHKFKSGKVTTYIPSPPRSNGAANMGLGDRTGSPIAGGGSSCTNCHFSGNYNPAITITVYDAGLNPITSYVPGTNYLVEYTVTAGTGSPAGFGFQTVLLNSSNQSTGSLVSAISPNTQIVPFGGNEYLEHMGFSTSGVFQGQWTAPSAGTGSVSIYARGMAVDGQGDTFGDEATSSQLLTLTEVVPTTISYPGTPFCDDVSNQTPVQTGETGGVFSGPVGLDINAGSGVINIGNSTPGTYQVDYQYSQGTTSFSVTINPTFNESTTASLCDNETLSFGTQTLSSSDAGLNTEVFQSANGCDSTVTLDLSVLPTSTEFIDAFLCPGDTVTFNGQGYTNADDGYTETLVLTASNGCDSIQEFSVSGEVIDPSISLNGNTITATQNNATYQWVDCDNNNDPITGETGQSYTPTTAGNYAVEVTIGNCTVLSSCQSVAVGLEDLNIESLQITPNPVVEVLTITGAEHLENITEVLVVDESGRLQLTFEESANAYNVSELASGIYFLVLRSNGEEYSLKFVKE